MDKRLLILLTIVIGDLLGSTMVKDLIVYTLFVFLSRMSK